MRTPELTPNQPRTTPVSDEVIQPDIALEIEVLAELIHDQFAKRRLAAERFQLSLPMTEMSADFDRVFWSEPPDSGTVEHGL